MKCLTMIGVLAISTAVSAAPVKEAPATLDQVVSNVQVVPPNMSKTTFDALSDAGKAYGACVGLSRKQYEINKEIGSSADMLDSIFNFNALLIRPDTPGTSLLGAPAKNTDGAILPPVLTQVDEVFDQKSDDLIRVYDSVYRIQENARFVSSAPNWRDYLVPSYDTQECPKAPIRPTSSDEVKVWTEAVQEGWKIGFAQGDKILEDNLNRLKRDFEGRIRYHILLRKGMVSAPIAAGAAMGVTGDGRQVMNVNETIYRITVKPEFNLEPKSWK